MMNKDSSILPVQQKAISSNAQPAQLKTVTIQNTTNSYETDWINQTTQSTGVKQGPQEEAKRVQDIMGGSWVGGHMINDRLGGSGGFENIVPITNSMNNSHHTIENKAQQKIRRRENRM